MKTILFCSIYIILSSSHVKADSPLTSTPFHVAYSELSIMVDVKESNGKLNAQIFEYLRDLSIPIDKRISVINGLGWDVNGKSNSKKFLKYLNISDMFKDEQELLASERFDLILCYAYLMAMDNYFEVDRAYEISLQALKLNSTSYTTNIISSLIHAQTFITKEWGIIFPIVDNVRLNKGLVQDMKKNAIDIIFDYMDMYNIHSIKN